MEYWPGLSYFNGTNDQQVRNEKSLVYGVLLLTSVTGGDITLYDGIGADAARKFGTLEGIANETRPIMFPKPVCFENGVYVEVGSNVTEYTIIYTPGNVPYAQQVEQA